MNEEPLNEIQAENREFLRQFIHATTKPTGGFDCCAGGFVAMHQDTEQLLAQVAAASTGAFLDLPATYIAYRREPEGPVVAGAVLPSVEDMALRFYSEEEEWPAYHEVQCPKEILDLLSSTDNETALAWRARSEYAALEGDGH